MTTIREVTKDTPNPANVQAEAGQERGRRIPMSVPVRKLEVDPIPGFHLHWHRESNVDRAKQAGYELVTPTEVRINHRSIGNDKTLGGNTDLGSCVSIVGSADSANVERLVLMKLKEEWWQEDKAALDARNASIVEGIFEGEKVGIPDGAGTQDLPANAYVKTAILNRGPRKAKQTRGPRGRY